MSVRRSTSSGSPHVAQLQKELADLKNTATQAAIDTVETPGLESTISFDSLNENEKSAASLGVHPESWKPIVRSPPCQSMPDHASPCQTMPVHTKSLTCACVFVCAIEQGFMNNAHYDTLIKSNALDSDLARRIEAYKLVAESSQ